MTRCDTEGDVKRIVLVTGHYFDSKRKAGFHWLAEAFWQAGWEVVFVTASLSWLSFISRDHRLQYPVVPKRMKLEKVRDRFWSYVWFTPWHPANLRHPILNKLATPLYEGYGSLRLGEIEPLIAASNVVVFESSPGLMLFERFKKLNPEARYIYRVSDDLRLLKNHPAVIAAEERIASQFDLISTPSESIYRIFAHLPQAVQHTHGIAKDLYDEPCDSPYESGVTNVVFCGNTRFDRTFLDLASELFPDWRFHIIGPIPDLPRRENVIAYGEMPFKETIPYVKHADVGLQCLSYTPGAECFTDSLKIIQYTYCRLPIVAPAYLRSSRTNMIYYELEDRESIRKALLEASRFERSIIDMRSVLSWDEIAQALLEPDNLTIACPPLNT